MKLLRTTNMSPPAEFYPEQQPQKKKSGGKKAIFECSSDEHTYRNYRLCLPEGFKQQAKIPELWVESCSSGQMLTKTRVCIMYDLCSCSLKCCDLDSSPKTWKISAPALKPQLPSKNKRAALWHTAPDQSCRSSAKATLLQRLFGAFISHGLLPSPLTYPQQTWRSQRFDYSRVKSDEGC